MFSELILRWLGGVAGSSGGCNRWPPQAAYDRSLASLNRSVLFLLRPPHAVHLRAAKLAALAGNHGKHVCVMADDGGLFLWGGWSGTLKAFSEGP